ncbi:MAG: phytanoyl-CoA dioxygenase family protein [Myxococcota bacterium]|jgi:hypothetical protein|nr:phytanoyl-CoA dioxygenase family protein [Myxococcota bacterium]
MAGNTTQVEPRAANNDREQHGGAEIAVDEMRATEEELAQYERDGYFARTGVLSESELASYREAVDGIHDQIVRAAQDPNVEPARLIDGKRYQKLLGSSVQWEWREGAEEIRSMEPYHHLDSRLEALLEDIRLWGPSRAIVGSEEISLFSDKLNFKRPAGAPFPWHQDNPYWAFLCDHLDRLVSVGIILDDSTIENGCLWMIPGSHKHGALDCFEDRGVVGRLYTDIERYDELADPVPMDLPAGSVVYFHGDIVHGSMSNRTDERRRMLVLTYQPDGLERWQQEDVHSVSS